MRSDTFEHNCAYETLHLDENEVGEERDGPSFASLNYYFSTMAAQEARFLKYLGVRTGRMRNFRQGEPVRPAAGFELISLRRWNSFSPNLGSRAAASVGGGYLVRIWSEAQERYVGIGVDPGYNYLENLFNEGYTIPDIDILLITHAHPDHTENLTNLFTLLWERDKRMTEENSEKMKGRNPPQKHQIIMAMTEGVFERYASHLKAAEKFIRDIVVLKAAGGRGSDASANRLVIGFDSPKSGNESSASGGGESKKDYPCHVCLSSSLEDTNCWQDEDAEVSPPDGEEWITLQAKHAWHDDQTGHDSIGVVIESDKARLGIISDSRYHPKLADDYGNCDLIVAHLGGLLPESQYSGFHEKGSLAQEEMLTHLHRPDEEDPCPPENAKDCSAKCLGDILKDANHLYLPGFCRFICDFFTPRKRPQASQGTSGNGPSKRNGKLPMFVLSEFGEELRGGLRTDLTRRLSDCLSLQRDCLLKDGKQEKISILPCDVGLRIDIENGTIFCSVCHRYVQPAKIRPESVLPGEEALAYVCEDCRTLRKGELPELLREWCQTGRPVVPLDPFKGDAGQENSAGEDEPSG